MTQLINPTRPISLLPNSGGGLDIIGTQGDNRLFFGAGGRDQADFILTFSGNDSILSGGGDDLILSGGGNDYIVGQAGNDRIFSGSGNDLAAGNSGNDTIFGGKGADLLDGGEGNDLVAGDTGNDIALGSSGNDRVFGGQGSDAVAGGDGNDSVFGGRDNDTVDGGAGNDSISGDRGADVLIGGGGSDTFYFFSAGGDFGTDTIADFTPSEDKIRLQAGGAFSGLGSTFDTSEFVVVSGFTPGSPAATTANKLIYDPQSGLLYFNNGSLVLTLAQLQPGLTITSSNFELF
ncbi:MAG: calcium-binding protein [Oscillatoriales cyanobacterium RU_3_3]|nr:calcium-binding protein [Oscillatoriales cyanobacterium RU_3_3]NJR22922.1 calcium-binding protein [Richelia sp. CSU_2_1]